MTLKERVKSPTPRFFRKVRNIGLILAAMSATIITAPIALPAVVIEIAGYLAVAGSVASAISQTTTKKDEERLPVDEDYGYEYGE